jgi:fibronectin type 3 domain-containing protein
MNVFYRYNGLDSSDTGSYSLSGTTPTQLATSTYSSLNLFKTATSTLEIGGVYSSGNREARLSRVATVLTYTLSVPSAPTNLTASSVGSTQMNLAWSDNSTNETGFRIYRALDNGSYSKVATTTWNTVAYNNAGLTADHTYSYKVSAYNSTGEVTSSIATAITYNTAPADPSSLTAFSSGSDVVLGWTDNSTNEDLFSIERGTDGVSFSQIATTTLNLTGSTAYTDVGAGSGSYYYRVRAYNLIGYSGYSNVVAYSNVTSPPNAPTDLAAVNYSASHNNLTWDNSDNEAGFKVYRAQNGGSYALATTTVPNAVSYGDTGLTADQTYAYQVVAYNAVGTATSNVATAGRLGRSDALRESQPPQLRGRARDRTQLL